MKKYFFIIFVLFYSTYLHAQDNLKFYIEKALENNLQLNAERKNFESAKQNKNISRSEFLPSLTISGSQSSIENSKIKDHSGTEAADTKRNTETKKISVDQKRRAAMASRNYNGARDVSIWEIETIDTA